MPYVGETNNNLPVTLGKGWVSFWFEGNQAWGMICGPGEWQVLKKAYPNIDLRTAKESTSYGASINMPYYGFRSECEGPKTLGEFFDENGMEI